MTDLEITKLCAEAMTLRYVCNTDKSEYDDTVCLYDGGSNMWKKIYDPLRNDEQAMALVKKCDLHITQTIRTPHEPRGKWFVSKTDKYEVIDEDLNRAICECVAKMQEARK